MWIERTAWTNDTDKEYARKWYSWYFAAGQWTAVDDQMVEGFSRHEMILQYGGYADAPMLSLSTQHEVTCKEIHVYSLDFRRFSDEEQRQLQEHQEKRDVLTGEPWEEYQTYTDQWEKDNPDLVWLDTWESVHPSSYMVFIDYGVSGDTIETHHIYCCTYPDLLELLRLHA